MATKEQSLTGDVVWQSGDDLSEANLKRTVAQSNSTDYVERGLGVTVDDVADTIDIGAGHAVIADGTAAYHVFPDAITDVSVPNGSGTNYVYLAIRPGTDDDIYVHVDDDDTPPADPALKIAHADAGAGTATAQNGDPDASFESVNAGKITNDTGLLDSRVSLGQQTPVIESWKRQSLDYYTINTGSGTFDTSTVLQGNASLRNSDQADLFLLSPFEAERGYRYRLYYYFDQHSSQTTQLLDIQFGTDQGTRADSGDGYVFRLRVDNPSIIERRDGGAGTQLASTTTNPQLDQWGILEIDLGFKHIEMRSIQLDNTQNFELTANDDTYSGLYFQSRIRSDESGSHTYCDYITRRPL
ncbi:hypothetical protein VB779_08720 [Haloarculaceae archaeon H-GB11]|nr:hypothetical protein [Haloarculaceae archaeon H-GB11]